jgi:uncharacterized coiled-coil DUF342 family protein
MSDFNFLNQETTVVGAITVVGGLLLKLIERVWNKDTVSLLEEHSALRKELRDELDAVRQELVRIQEEVDEWREKYYQQVETTNELLYEVSVLKGRLHKYESITGEFGYKFDD